jgi:SAM-dependent MidA family methyltransferase
MMGQVISGLGLLSRLRWSFRIVEVAQPLREQQGKRLWWRGVKWFNTLASAVQEGDSCLIFANELIDAFAPIIVERMGAQWLEVALLVKNGEIVESLREPSERCAKAIATSSVCKAGWGEREGARVEILFGFKEWLMEVRPYLQSTRILLIDYGDEAEGLCKNHPRGTLRGYFRQQKVTGMEVARRFGKQDITCDVNFTDVANWAVEAGFEVRVTATQPSFIKEYLVGAENNRLTSETDAGGYFRVIELAV